MGYEVDCNSCVLKSKLRYEIPAQALELINHGIRQLHGGPAEFSRGAEGYSTGAQERECR